MNDQIKALEQLAQTLHIPHQKPNLDVMSGNLRTLQEALSLNDNNRIKHSLTSNRFFSNNTHVTNF